MGMEIMYVVLQSSDSDTSDGKIKAFKATEAGQDFSFYRVTTDEVNYQLYGVISEDLREDVFLEAMANLSKAIPNPILAGMIIDNAGFDGAWIFHGGEQKLGFATEQSRFIPESEIGEDAIEKGFQAMNLPLTYAGFHDLILDCDEPVEI